MGPLITVFLWCIQVVTALLILLQTYFNVRSAHARYEVLRRKRRVRSLSLAPTEEEQKASLDEKSKTLSAPTQKG